LRIVHGDLIADFPWVDLGLRGELTAHQRIPPELHEKLAITPQVQGKSLKLLMAFGSLVHRLISAS
jgi:hypothetical protein